MHLFKETFRYFSGEPTLSIIFLQRGSAHCHSILMLWPTSALSSLCSLRLACFVSFTHPVPLVWPALPFTLHALCSLPGLLAPFPAPTSLVWHALCPFSVCSICWSCSPPSFLFPQLAYNPHSSFQMQVICQCPIQMPLLLFLNNFPKIIEYLPTLYLQRTLSPSPTHIHTLVCVNTSFTH